MAEVVSPRGVTYRVTCHQWLRKGESTMRTLPTICVHMCSVWQVSRHASYCSIRQLPEFPLRRRALGSESRVERVRMNLDEREVAIDKAQLVPEFLLQGSHQMRRLARIGAFVVAILHQRDRSTAQPLAVVPVSN